MSPTLLTQSNLVVVSAVVAVTKKMDEVHPRSKDIDFVGRRTCRMNYYIVVVGDSHECWCVKWETRFA